MKKIVFVTLITFLGANIFAQKVVIQDKPCYPVDMKIYPTTGDDDGTLFLSSIDCTMDSLIFNFNVSVEGYGQNFNLLRAVFDNRQDVVYVNITKNADASIGKWAEKDFSLVIPKTASYLYLEGFSFNGMVGSCLIKLKTNQLPDYLLAEENVVDLSEIIK
ncbi:MAG: hypothetical protein KKD31_19495 [Bacteroidetes bacterium]|nr:hypothetical protein [Bacteroidota bacterium]